MTLAEVILLVAAAIGLYFLFRPLQRRLESYLATKVFARHSRSTELMIDVTDYTSSASDTKDENP